VERDTRFPKFERWIEKGYPSVYEEEIYHQSELAIGILLFSLGITLLAFSSFTTTSVEVIGLGVLSLGIFFLVVGITRFRHELRQYCYHGLTRNTISDAIMSLDAHIVTSDEVELLAPYYDKPEPLRYEGVRKRNALIKFIKNTAGLIEWPSDFIIRMKENLKQEEKQIRTCSISFIVILLIPISIIYYLATRDFLLLSVFFVPLAICIVEVSYYYVRTLYDLSYLLRDDWLNDVFTSDSVQLDETMVSILNLLHSEFQWPLRFYLGRQYPQLVYTGRTKTAFHLARLKEAILYPEQATHNI
jgi:hypothetical protein